MKKTLLSIIGLLLIGELMAGHSKVTFYSTYGEPFILTVNGERINHRPATRVYLDHLAPGNNRIHLRIKKRGHYSEIRCPIFVEAGFHSDFAIRPTHHRRYTVERVSATPLFAHYRDHYGSHVSDYYGQAEYYYEDDYYGRYDGKKRRGQRWKDGNHRNRRSYVNMEDVLYSLSYYHFDKEKVAYARRAVKGKFIYSRDVSRIMNEFTFDRAKIDFAVFAHQYVADPENYYKVKATFTFRSSVRDLNERLPN